MTTCPRDRPEQRLLIVHGALVGLTVAVVCQHHRQIAHNPARIVPAAAFGRQRPRERIGEPEPVGSLDQQRGARVLDQSLSVRHNI